jgi:DNA recombination protein RmuC
LLEVLYILLGLAIGLALGWFIGALRTRGTIGAEAASAKASLDEVRGHLASRESEMASLRQSLETEKVTGADARARLESAREHFAEQRKQIEQLQEKLRDAFKALSADALKNNNEQFAVLAETRMKPLREQLERYEKQLGELEKTRASAYGGLTEKLEALQQRETQLSAQTQQLVSALRQPGAKGRWGEVTLQRIVEMAGLAEHCDFITQSTQAGGQRPDMIVQLPGGRCLAIDSKVNASSYLDAMEAGTEADKSRLIDKFVAEVKTTLRGLGAKEYWRDLSPAPEFVVMFMSSEAFFSTAVGKDPSLIMEGLDQHRVLLASPTTLIALLMAVRHGWQQQQVAENAQHIADVGRELYDRLCKFVEHMEKLRDSLEGACKSYNAALGNLESRTIPGARRLKDLGAGSPGELPLELRIETPLKAASIQGSDAAIDARRAS